ncbi:Tubulinyl-Tyr carboxypeptidase 2, partial [Coelomomyces lativittatus]
MSSNSLHRLKIRKGSQCTSNSYLSTTTLSTQSSDCDQLYRKMKFACTSFECKIKPLSLPIVPIPIPLTPKHLKKTSPEVYLSECQNLLNLLGYNYISEPFFVVNKKAPYRRLQSLAIDMLKFSLPIKCLEAVVLGFYLTRFLKGSIVRIPLAFKSECFGESYRHIVLAIYNLSSKKWGAIGLSRRSDLMDKAFVFE